MKSVDLWNQLVSEGCPIIDNKITPGRDIYIKAQGVNNSIRKTKVKYLSNNGGDITIHTATPVYFSRFNQGVCTINLVHAGLSANKDLDAFWTLFDERLELCHKALQCRYERLSNVKR